MEISDDQSAIWREIDRAESYLVCSMYDEAATSAYSVLKQLLENDRGEGEIAEADYEDERYNMLESAGMVLVQSMRQLQRTAEIMKELKQLFGAVIAIPFEVFLTAVCFQISDTSSSSVESSLQEFLTSFEYVDGQYFPLCKPKAGFPDRGESYSKFPVAVGSYLKIVDLYVISVLAKKNIDFAISWVEKAMLPMEKIQELLRQLHSSEITTSSVSSTSLCSTDELGAHSLPDQNVQGGDHKDTGYHVSERNKAKQEVFRLAQVKNPFFCWFPAVNLKIGKARVAVSSGKFLLATLMLLMYYFTRKKQAFFRRLVASKATLAKRALLDLWQLAFSYHVNPLAAVQSLPTATR